MESQRHLERTERRRLLSFLRARTPMRHWFQVVIFYLRSLEPRIVDHPVELKAPELSRLDAGDRDE